MTTSILLAAVLCAAAAQPAKNASGPTSALEKCRTLDGAFDTKNMPKPCGAAADDATLPIADRAEALRRLAFAHILNGDEALAEPAFMKMLVFTPTAELPADAGPKVREIFNQVKKRFDVEGQLNVSFTAPAAPKGVEPVTISIDVGDKLGRVVGARLRATVLGKPEALEEKLVRAELGPGELRFSGPVPEPKEALPADGRNVTYDVIFDGWDGNAIATAAPVHGTFTRGGAAPVAEDAFPWLWVGVGSASAVAVAGGVTGGLIYCFTVGPCRTQDAWVRVQIHEGAAP